MTGGGWLVGKWSSLWKPTSLGVEDWVKSGEGKVSINVMNKSEG
jgi:hypothetical protein